MRNVTKGSLVAAVVIVAALQWQYDIGHKAIAYFQGTPATDTATAQSAAPSGSKRGSGGPTNVKLAQASKGDMPLIEHAYGTSISPQIAVINARIASQVINVPVTDGQMVKKGDLLIELDDRTFQATLAKDQATMAKDSALRDNANLQLQRAKTLLSRSAGPQADVDTAIATAKSAEQVVESDKAQIEADKLQIEFAKITAPIDGKLGQLNVVPGNLVSATLGTGLMSVTQLQPLKVSFRLPEQVLNAVRVQLDSNTDVTVRVLASSSTTVLDTGKVSFIDSSVDAASGTIGMATTVSNDKLQLWPGQHVDVEVQYGVLKDAVIIPAVAIQQGQKGAYVWKVDDQMKVAVTPVEVGRYEGPNAAISKGLTIGDQIVIEGQGKLSNGAQVKAGTDKPVADAAATGDATVQPADVKTEHKKNKQGDAQQSGQTP
jgi:multidrug efflux system membrane fusion protein